MADLINLTTNSPAVIARLQDISRQFADLSPAMRAIGEVLSESTKQRFTDSTAPDGARWEANSPATVLAMLNRISGAYSKKSGKISAKGIRAATGKRPLVDSGLLQDTIAYQLTGDGNGVEIGTNRFAGEWAGGAAVHQFGSRNGKIPARPFLGLSADDERQVLAILDHFAGQALGE